MRLGKWHNNVYMNVVETEVTDGRACGMRPLCVAGFRLLARDAGWRPPANITVQALPNEACPNGLTSGSCTWMSEVVYQIKNLSSK